METAISTPMIIPSIMYASSICLMEWRAVSFTGHIGHCLRKDDLSLRQTDALCGLSGAYRYCQCLGL